MNAVNEEQLRLAAAIVARESKKSSDNTFFWSLVISFPLGVTASLVAAHAYDRYLWPSGDQTRRLAKSYKPAASGKGLEETPVYFIKDNLSDRKRTPIPAGGLFSTARDVATFYQMMVDGGEFRGKRLLSPAAIGQMTRTQTGDIKTGFVDGMSWGLGFQVVKQPQGVTAMLSPGTFGHGGAYATQSWADPKRNLVLVLMIQRAGFQNGDASPVRKAFQEAAVAME
jgi:CubicO group peptidase (beta-lactamase class C family)